MKLNLDEYIDAFENLVVTTGHSPDISSPRVRSAFERMCRILGIAFAEAVINNGTDELTNIVFYDSKTEYDKNNSLCAVENVNDYKVSCYLYTTFNHENSTIQDKLNTFLRCMINLSVRLCEEKTYKELAFFDRQLNIYNIEYFMRTAQRLIFNEEIDDYYACCYDLKCFSLINNKIGKEAGTKLMRKYACLLQNKLKENGWVCRVSGDTFIVLFHTDALDAVMEHLKGQKIFCEGENEFLTVSAHAGYYKITDKKSTPMDIRDKANAALQNAKNYSKIPYAFYDNTLQERIDEAKRIAHIFPSAIENEEFLVYYQPKTQLRNYQLYGAEALCRWVHDGEMIMPYKFVPLLESNHDICQLDFYMLEHVCRDIRRWLDEGKEVVKVSVNFSRCHLGDEDLLDSILAVINRYNIPHEYIELELTETTTDVDFNVLKGIVTSLRKEGISVSVDDFGVGYSSLNLIRDIPWTVLKIDKCFLPEEYDTDEDKQKKTIMLKSVIMLSQALGLECITEGVETLEQIMLLKKSNCFLAQGYYFDKPLPVEEFEKRLISQKILN